MHRFVCLFIIFLLPGQKAFSTGESGYPVNNPVEKYQLDWTDVFHWDNVMVMDPLSENPGEDFKKMQEVMSKKGGGIIYFPPGNYHFDDHIYLKSNIIIRGADPSRTDKFNPAVPDEKLMPIIDARDRRYELTSVFIFPLYNGDNRQNAFKGIRLEDPLNAENSGVVNIEINHGHIAFGDKKSLQENASEDRIKGNILIYGNILRNTAVAGTTIPMEGQNPHQIWIERELGAITVFAGRNILIANNRIPGSGDHNFLMNDFRLYPSREAYHNREKMISMDIWFDYDNRSGIRVNFMPMLERLSIWEKHEQIAKARNEGKIKEIINPGTLAEGIIIRDNYVFSTGKGGIKSTGLGTHIAYNVIRCFPELELPAYTGQFTDAFVNDVRAIEIRGWEWIIEGNDFEIYSNYTHEGIKYNDGEGIMHEAWENVGIRNSILRNNTGNQYLCFWRVPVNGLVIEGNKIRTKLEWHAIFVNAQARYANDNYVDLPADKVVIKGNITEGGGIKLLGNGKENSIKNNLHSIANEALLIDATGAKIEGNTGYIKK